MKKTKRAISFLLVMIVFCLILPAGCKKSEKVGAEEDNPVVTEEEKKAEGEDQDQPLVFGFSTIDMSNPYYITLENAIREDVEKQGDTMITMDAANNLDTQEQQITELISKGINILFLTPVDWEKITPSLEALKSAGVKVINLDSRVKDTDLVDAYVGSDNQEAGSLIGEDLMKRYPEGGKIAILESLSQNAVTERIKGFEEKIAEAANGFEVVERKDTGGEFDQSLSAAKEILQTHPEVQVIICGNDQIAVGAQTAANLLEKTSIAIYGADGSPDIKKELTKNDSQVVATVAQSPINIGKTAMKIAAAIENGDDYEKENLENVFLITRDNVQVYGAEGWQ